MILVFSILFFLPSIADSCSPYVYSCGNFTLEIQYPFYTDANTDCDGLHFVQCMNQVPVVKLRGEGFLFPVWNISYADGSFVVHDLKLSSYFRGSDCSFLYDFSAPIARFNVSNATEYVTSSRGFFDCDPHGYDFSGDFFRRLWGVSSCKNYSLDYSRDSEVEGSDGLPGYCSTSSDLWFDWRLSFGEDIGRVSLMSAGFSRKWAPFPDCFACRIAAGNCSEQCRGARQNREDHSSKKLIIGISFGVILVASNSIVFVWFCFGKHFWKSRGNHSLKIESFLKKYESLATKRHTYSSLKRMTKSFSEKLGQGGYGSVYKGKLPDGRVVAVKMLSETKGDGEDFIAELAAIGNASHVNIVSVRGFCVEGSKRALIYDFMPNGSLEKYIHSPKLIADASLGWEKLFEIATGIARGLEYLHRGCNTRIVHFDIKPHNILLDEEFLPKISDFGMAKLCHPKESIISLCGARGTIGYIAPELFSRSFGVVSSKSDVYSYGMMVLDMFGGKSQGDARSTSASEAYFPQSIYQHLSDKPDLTEYGVTDETEGIARKMMIVAFWCIQTMPEHRPSISRVVDMLEGNLADLPVPPKPILSSPLDLIAGFCTTSSS